MWGPDSSVWGCSHTGTPVGAVWTLEVRYTPHTGVYREGSDAVEGKGWSRPSEGQLLEWSRRQSRVLERGLQWLKPRHWIFTPSSEGLALTRKQASERQRGLSEAQTANAQGGRQASLWELRSSPVPGEAELGVPESEEFADAEDGQRTREHTRSLRKVAPTRGVDA